VFSVQCPIFFNFSNVKLYFYLAPDSDLKFPIIVAVTVAVNLKDHKMPVCRLDSRTVQQRMTHKTTMQMLTVQQRMAHRTTMQSLARFNNNNNQGNDSMYAALCMANEANARSHRQSATTKATAAETNWNSRIGGWVAVA
jgi:hypothetical protein